eukprot:TRINITY_DN8193_c0_g1_i1.p1 TRINITY_DN8193_c0_g1~~TRINITY_DN8193_c0_g1_i1.p1  ORF type:complete len:168 (-),score=38.97 TRINITY_DN8193_c0_g1_i1:81-584(-)
MEQKKKYRNPSIEYGEVTVYNVNQVKLLNTLLFPVRYDQSFYKKIVKYPELSRIAYYNDVMVGCVSARVEKKDNEDVIYIMTVGVLPPYRRAKIGSKLIDFIEEFAKEKNKDRKDNKIKKIYLHVQVNNDSAISFYSKLGFVNVEKLVGYYSRIEPADCYVLERIIS